MQWRDCFRRPSPFAAGSAAALLMGAWAGVASAAPGTSFTSALITDANAVTDDPNLAGRVQNMMVVTIPATADWTNSKIRIQLTTGSIYNATNAVATENAPNAQFWTFPGARNGPFDTFVNSKGTGATPDSNPSGATILGSVNPDGSDGPLPASGLSTNGATLVAVSWGDTVAGESGTFSVGRFTLSANATGTFFGQTFDSTSGGVGTPFNGTITAGVMSIPEPTGLALGGIGAAGLLGWRRRRAR